MKETARLLRISAMAFVMAFAAGSSWAADAVQTLPDMQAPKQPTLVQPQIKKYEPAKQTQRVPSSVPAAPAGLKAVSPMGTEVILTWKDMSANEQSFDIERKTGRGGFIPWITNVAPNLTTITDTKVDLNTTYTYRIRAFNTRGYSPYSNEETVAVKLPATAGEIIQCPELKKGFLTCTIQSPVPPGWKAMDDGASVDYIFNSASDFLGTVTCVYGTPAGTVRLTRPAPQGKTCKAIDKKYFICQ
jgi:hypothetical protein